MTQPQQDVSSSFFAVEPILWRTKIWVKKESKYLATQMFDQFICGPFNVTLEFCVLTKLSLLSLEKFGL